MFAVYEAMVVAPANPIPGIVISKLAASYDRLFHMMIDRKITNAKLMNMCGFSANIITRLKKDEHISLESVEKICRTLNCGVDEILEFTADAE